MSDDPQSAAAIREALMRANRAENDLANVGVEGVLSVLEEVLASNYETSINGQLSVRAETRESNREFYTAFPDFHREMHELLIEPPFAAFRWTMTGTQRDTYLGLPATGRTINFSGMSMWEFEAGRVRRSWVSFDPAVMMRQLTAPSEG
jgi:steroid delta-isomerase-like uncharacterized protein